MAQMSLKRHINAPIEAVFARATDFPNAANAVTAITKMEMLTDGPVGLGTRFRETRMMFGREATEEMEVVEFEPPSRFRLHAESHGSRYRTEYRYTEADGGTDLEMIFEATPLTFFAKVMSVVMMPMMKKMMVNECGKDLDELKAAAEAG